MSKQNKQILFAINDSRSVTGNDFFWLEIEKQYQEICKKYDENDVHIVCYGNYEATRISGNELAGMVQRRRGHEQEHSLKSLVDYIRRNKFHGDLMVFNDGHGTDVEQAKDEMKQHGKMKSSKVFIIGGDPNAELFQPFTLDAGSTVTSITSEGTKEILKTEEDDRSTFLGIEKMNIHQFLENFDKIYNYITKPHLFGYAHHSKTRTIYDNQTLRNILMKEKSRLVYEYGKMKKGDIEIRLMECIETGNFEKATEVMQELADKYYESVNSTTNELSIEEKIDKLIKLCGEQKTNAYDDSRVRSNRTDRAKTVKDVDLNDMDIDPTMSMGLNSLVQCPLSGEEDVPVLIITEFDLLHGIAKNITNEIISCPFSLVNYPILKDRILNSIDGFVGLKTIKENNIKESPFNGKPIEGGIILSNQKEMVEVTKSTIAKMFCDGKLLGAAVSYLVAIYECIKDEEQYEGCLVPLQNVIVEMLKTSHSNAAMTGNVSQICTPLRADIAYWFVAHSCLIKIPPANSPFILHINEMKSIIDIIDKLGYPVSDKVRNHMTHFQIVQTLHRMKFINSDVANNLIRALYQKAIYINKHNIRKEVLDKEYYLPFIFVDGEADQEQIDKVLSLINPIFSEVPVKDIVSLNTFAHEKWRINGTMLPVDLPPVEMKIETNWDGMKCGDLVVDIQKMKQKFIAKYKSEPQSQDEFLLFLFRRLQKSTVPSFEF